LPRLAPLAAAAMLAAGPCQAAWQLAPTLGVTETYTDNVNLQSSARAESAFVTDATPGLALTAHSRRLQLDASAQWHEFAYNGARRHGTRNSQYQYQLDGKSTLVDELLYLDASAAGGPQAISAFGPQVDGNLFAMGNRTNVRTWRLSPYVAHHFGDSANLTLRYTSDAVDSGMSNLYANSRGKSAAFQLASGDAWRTLGWNLDLNDQHLDYRQFGGSSAKTALGKLRYRLGSHWAATASAGYDKYDYQSLGGRTAGRNWSGGFVWAPTQHTNVQASIGRRYFGKTGALNATLRNRRMVWSVNYNDMVTTTREQFILPAAVDTASMLDQLFAGTIPDAAARAQAVTAYMQANGLPATLADSINYLSNRYIRQKQLQAAMALRGAHGEVLLTAFTTVRNALSAQQTDSGLLGGAPLSLNDDTRQRGLSAGWNYQLNARSTALAQATVARTLSQTTGIVSLNRVLRAGIRRQLSGRFAAAFELRHTGGSIGAGGQGYRENAISATLTSKF
jgi:uncharacterized protein (PEP-CTERM system associated)